MEKQNLTIEVALYVVSSDIDDVCDKYKLDNYDQYGDLLTDCLDRLKEDLKLSDNYKYIFMDDFQRFFGKEIDHYLEQRDNIQNVLKQEK